MKFISPKSRKSAVWQAKFFSEIEKRGIQCELEYRVDRLVIDAVVVKNDEIIALVEAKRTPCKNNRWWKTKQCERYSKLGIPVFLINSQESVDKTVQEIEKIYGS